MRSKREAKILTYGKIIVEETRTTKIRAIRCNEVTTWHRSRWWATTWCISLRLIWCSTCNTSSSLEESFHMASTNTITKDSICTNSSSFNSSSSNSRCTKGICSRCKELSLATMGKVTRWPSLKHSNPTHLVANNKANSKASRTKATQMGRFRTHNRWTHLNHRLMLHHLHCLTQQTLPGKNLRVSCIQASNRSSLRWSNRTQMLPRSSRVRWRWTPTLRTSQWCSKPSSRKKLSSNNRTKRVLLVPKLPRVYLYLSHNLVKALPWSRNNL